MDPSERYRRSELIALGKKIGYVDVGRGDPIVFVHGIGGSAYGWRNVIPSLANYNRCIAVDLVGMGESANIEPSGQGTYDFETFYQYLDASLDMLDVDGDVILVLHDFGSLLGLEWARNHRNAIRGIAYAEAVIGPMALDDFPEDARELLRLLRGPDGEEAMFETDIFFDELLPRQSLRRLSPAERDSYYQRYEKGGETRRALRAALTLLPIEGNPLRMAVRATRQLEWLAASEIPKLFIDCEPGYISSPIAKRVSDFPNQARATVSSAHLPHEDSPMQLASVLLDWCQSIKPK